MAHRVLPVVAALLTLFFGKRTPGKGAVYGDRRARRRTRHVARDALAFVQGGGTVASSVNWFTVGPFHLELGQYVDGLAAIMLVVVTSVSLCVHVYSLGYMDGDFRFTWFYVVLSLFTAAMLNVVIAPNLIQLLIGWEVIGVCSYLLIGHWYEDKENSNAAIKAFITTRIGDVPFMFGIFALIFATGFTTSNIQRDRRSGRKSGPHVVERSWSRPPRCCSSAARSASRRSSRCTSGCRTRWPARRRCRR